MSDTPKLDRRTAGQVVDQALGLAEFPYLPGWEGRTDPQDPARGLIGIFGRLMEILIERLNRVPEKQFLRFLDMVGVEPVPGRPASVPVTFLTSAKSPSGGQVPAGTQVATTQTDTSDAHVFESAKAFFATPAKLQRILNLEPSQDKYLEIPPPSLPPKQEDAANPFAVEVLGGNPGTQLDIPHVLYLGSEAVFGRKEILDVRVVFTLSAGNPLALAPATLKWRRFDANAKAWIDLAPTYDYTQANQVAAVFASFPGTAKSTLGGVADFWIACHYQGDFTLLFPEISAVRGKVSAAAADGSASSAPDAAFANGQALDLSKPYFPFGSLPRYGDAFYLGSAKAFAPEVATAKVTFTLKPYDDEKIKQVFANITVDTTVTTLVEWQYLDATGSWRKLFTYKHDLTVTTAKLVSRTLTRYNVDATVNFNVTDNDGSLFGLSTTFDRSTFTFAIPADMAPGKVGGKPGFWIRALLKSENPYGREAFIVMVTSGTTTVPKPVGPTFLPPIIESCVLEFQYKNVFIGIPSLLGYDNFLKTDHGPGFAVPGYKFTPFKPPVLLALGTNASIFGSRPALYFGFDREFGDVGISLYLQLRETPLAIGAAPESGNPQVTWEYLSRDLSWKALDVEDGTVNLQGSGILSFTGPSDSASAVLFDTVPLTGGPPQAAAFWMRARLSAGSFTRATVFRGAYLNTVMADNRITLKNDLVLGSGSGAPGQTALLLKSPVLDGELWVRESDAPTEAEMAGHQREFAEVEQGILRNPSPTVLVENRDPVPPATEKEVWVRWLQVPNFLGSGPRSRHYTLDRLTGAVTLGNGEAGLQAPIAKDNLVFRGFRTGGGEEANRGAQPLAVKELKSSLPFVEKVFNIEAATGGSDAWKVSDIMRFGPQFIRNRGRAVTVEDYEWMTLQRFSQIARVKCLATRAPSGGELVFMGGAVTMIAVPKGLEAKPQPPNALLRQIREYLAGQSLGSIGADIHVLGPTYLEIRVQAFVRALRPEENSDVERRIILALETFFHPLHGGEKGEGWEFGRSVHVSEVFAVIQRTEGVDYVERVDFPDHPGSLNIDFKEKNYLVSSGNHQIEMI